MASSAARHVLPALRAILGHPGRSVHGQMGDRLLAPPRPAGRGPGRAGLGAAGTDQGGAGDCDDEDDASWLVSPVVTRHCTRARFVLRSSARRACARHARSSVRRRSTDAVLSCDVACASVAGFGLPVQATMPFPFFSRLVGVAPNTPSERRLSLALPLKLSRTWFIDGHCASPRADWKAGLLAVSRSGQLDHLTLAESSVVVGEALDSGSCTFCSPALGRAMASSSARRRARAVERARRRSARRQR